MKKNDVYWGKSHELEIKLPYLAEDIYWAFMLGLTEQDVCAAAKCGLRLSMSSHRHILTIAISQDRLGDLFSNPAKFSIEERCDDSHLFIGELLGSRGRHYFCSHPRRPRPGRVVIITRAEVFCQARKENVPMGGMNQGVPSARVLW